MEFAMLGEAGVAPGSWTPSGAEPPPTPPVGVPVTGTPTGGVGGGSAPLGVQLPGATPASPSIANSILSLLRQGGQEGRDLARSLFGNSRGDTGGQSLSDQVRSAQGGGDTFPTGGVGL